ncbi:MAG: hypothetical protein AAGE13_12080 [Pseudomonadota bacterium]
MRLRRFLGALYRAVLVVALIVMPAFMLPGPSDSAIELSVIIGSVFGAVVLFEYASANPGLIDFRFAPPYNRARFIAFGTVLTALVLLCRADADATDFAPGYLGFVDGLVTALDFPYSPIHFAPILIVGPDAPDLALLVQRAAALGLTIAGAAAGFLLLVLWLLRWPPGREKFNLWVNLPTFKPSAGRSVERRLFFRAVLYLLLGLTLPLTLTVLASRWLGWFDPAALGSYRTLVWTMALWSFLPAAFVIRGVALAKIGYLVRRARTFG